MKISLGCDHGGYSLKAEIVSLLKERGDSVIDRGTSGPGSVDYPDFALPVARDVTEGRAEFGILICGTGIGMAMTANKVRGIRAANVSDVYSARMSRLHNNANVLALGARVIGPGLAREIVEVFLSTPFEGGRHERRVGKIADAERPGHQGGESNA